MSYRFRDRAKEWTSWVGLFLSALAAVIPQVVPPNTWWVEAWQAGQMGLGIAMIFIPNTAGSTAVENDAWSLLKAFSAQLPPAYAGPMQPLIQTLAGALAHSSTAASLAAAAQSQAQPTGPNTVIVPAQPVAPAPTTDPSQVQPVSSRPQPQPLVADPSAALHPMS